MTRILTGLSCKTENGKHSFGIITNILTGAVLFVGLFNDALSVTQVV